jgi:hypothetical protein
MTAVHYTTDEGGAWHAALSSHSPEAIHGAVATAEIIRREDGTMLAVDVLDFPDFHSIQVAGERWDAVSRRWEAA